ncbi:MAG: hypothetical protein PHP01_01065 [Phycisphaerae bacterium]|nr:hypothetical protein [Phycisphaerae bacterium]
MKDTSAAKLNLPAVAYLFLVGIAGWWIPGAGHWIIGQPKKAAIIFFSIAFALLLGIWLGSIAVIDAKTPWYWAQLLNSPTVAYLAHISHVFGLESYGKPRELGEIYTGIAGMLNLLSVVNAVYLAHCNTTKEYNK